MYLFTSKFNASNLMIKHNQNYLLTVLATLLCPCDHDVNNREVCCNTQHINYLSSMSYGF